MYRYLNSGGLDLCIMQVDQGLTFFTLAVAIFKLANVTFSGRVLYKIHNTMSNHDITAYNMQRIRITLALSR